MTPGVACILPNTATDAKTFHPNSCVTIPTENSVKDGGGGFGGMKEGYFSISNESEMELMVSGQEEDGGRNGGALG